MSTTKAIKGDRKRERVRKKNRDRTQSKNKTQHLKIPKSLKPKSWDWDPNRLPSIKNGIHMREREREREREWNRDRTFTNTKLLQSLWSYLGKRLGIVLVDLGFFCLVYGDFSEDRVKLLVFFLINDKVVSWFGVFWVRKNVTWVPHD